MSEEDYLWDKSGEPQAEVAHLEQILGNLRWSGRQPKLPRVRQANWLYIQRPWLIAAAALVSCVIAMTVFVQKSRAPQAVTSWQLSLAGQKTSSVRSGQVIETGLSGATMESEFVGEVRIDPNSRLRLLATREDRHRLALDHGTIHAFIWAPPTKFVVDTPAANAVDLGCQYTLSVEKDGQGFLAVEMGWVAFQWKTIESFIPEGAACTTHMGRGPDTPYFLDASEALTKALAEFDRTGNEQAVRSVLSAARPRDALTLWHLLERTKGEDRAAVFQRFAQLVNLPASVTREGILRGDGQSMDAAWDALKLGDTSWWREWKRNW
jgi:hypothetical protein